MEVIIPRSVKKIERGAFRGCIQLERVVIEQGTSSLRIIDERNYRKLDAFAECNSLQTVIVQDRPNWESIIDSSLLSRDTLKEIVLPLNYQDKGYSIVKHNGIAHILCVRVLEGKLIDYYDEKSIDFDIPDNVTDVCLSSIRRNTSVRTITIGPNVKYIEYGAFKEFKALQNILTSNNNLFFSSVNGVLFDKRKETILFYPGGRENDIYSIPISAKRIASNAFCLGKPQNLFIPDSVTEIATDAFSQPGTNNISINNIRFPSGFSYL